MREATAIDATKVALVRHLVDRIALAAARADSNIEIALPQLSGIEEEFAVAQIETLRESLRLIGWLADLVSAEVNGSPHRGDAKEWFLPELDDAREAS